MPFHGQLLNLKPNVLFVGYRGPNQSMAKVIVTGGSGIGKAWKPNRTAAMLLYLLCRDEKDYIHYDQFKQRITAKFNNVTPQKIDNILTKLNNKAVLDIKPETQALPRTPTPDPLKLFKGPKINWQPPTLTPDKEPATVKQKHAYSKGYFFITFWR